MGISITDCIMPGSHTCHDVCDWASDEHQIIMILGLTECGVTAAISSPSVPTKLDVELSRHYASGFIRVGGVDLS